MFIPDLTQSCKTAFDLRPRCVDIHPRRKAPSQSFQWTCVLVYDLTEEQVMNVTLPRQLRRFTSDMKTAFGEDGVKLTVTRTPAARVELDLVLHVGAKYLPAVQKASAVVKSVSLTASPGSCRVKWTLIVDAPRDIAPSFCDLVDCDVSVEVRTTGALPFPVVEADEDEDEDESDEGEAARRHELQEEDDEEEELGLDAPGDAGRTLAVETLENESMPDPGPTTVVLDPEPPKVNIDRAGGPVRRKPRASVLSTGATELPPEPQ